jgi:sulfate adenylyltransferase large subunit
MAAASSIASAAAASLASPDARADDVARWLRAQEDKELLRFVTIGSVDDGKSTLIGRLLHDAHGLYEDQLHAVRRASARGSTRAGGSSSEIDFSLVTDRLLAEREQGITIDVAYRYFATERRKFIIADTPGHVQYTRNMATGASTADLAIVLVDARLGVLAQTRRHAHIAALLGIRHVVACINKMDLVDFDRARFEAIRAELDRVAEKLGLEGVLALPVSALRGDNVATRSEIMGWWRGPTLLEHLETVPVSAARASDAPLRLPVQLVLRPGIGYRAFAGRIASGSVRPGDELLALPSGKRTRVVGVDVAGREVPEAFAPMNVAVRLADEIDVSRGDMLVHADAATAPRLATDFEADLVWLSERPLDREKTYLLKHTTRTARAEVSEILHKTNLETLDHVPAEGMSLNDIARVRVRARAPLSFDAYADDRATGAFVLIDSVTNDTVAAGMIARAAGARVGAGAGDASRDARGERTQVSAAERRARLGHAGAVVRVSAPSLEAARVLAFTIERELFDGGRLATVIEAGAEPGEGASSDARTAAASAEACARAGVIAIVAIVADAREDAVAVRVEGAPLERADAAGVLEALAARGVI